MQVGGRYMMFRKAAQSKGDAEAAKSAHDDKLPPIAGAEVIVLDDNKEVVLLEELSPARVLSDDENDYSSKQPTSIIVKSEDLSKPSAYIKPANFECWVRAMDVNGMIYYYNTKSGESTWLAPCVVCYKTGERFCLKCAAPYCDKHFQKKHKGLENPDEHVWSTQEQQTEREELTNPDEQEYCIECQLKIATRLCLECWDPYCQRCCELVHHVGNLKTHPIMTYGRAHEGWYTVRRYEAEEREGNKSMKMLAQTARAVSAAGDGSFIASGSSQRTMSVKDMEVKNASSKPGVMEYYVHGETKEVTYEKPIELMSDLEKILLQNWKRHQAAAEEYVAQVEAMSFELEKVKYERDSLLVENAQMAQGLVPVGGGNKKNKTTGNGSNTPTPQAAAGKQPGQAVVLNKLIETESNDYRQKLLHPSDRKRGEERANYMKNLLNEPLPK